jgi:serine/threonine-protein kinase
MIGKVISHYKIHEKLGEGGMGVVYRGEDLLLHRPVAIKFPSEVFTRKQSVRAHLLREARMAASLLHPNITVVYEVDEHEGHPFIVMEFVDGQTLRRAIVERGPLEIRTCASIAIQLCEGIKAVHNKEMIHRDIKTENILLSRAHEVKITDCGLAARIINEEGLAEELGIAGTTAYMSPEQIRGDQIDRRSDIFSAGVVLYEMLTGHLPFEAEQPSALMYLIGNTDPSPLQAHRKDIPPALSRVVHRALEKDPVDRYQQVDQMIEELQGFTRTFVD